MRISFPLLFASSITALRDPRYSNNVQHERTYDPDTHSLKPKSRESQATSKGESPRCDWKACSADFLEYVRWYVPVGDLDW